MLFSQSNFFVYLFHTSAVVSCEELSPPPNTQVSISAGVATITCATNGKTDTMTCVGDRWTGEISNCPMGKI